MSSFLFYIVVNLIQKIIYSKLEYIIWSTIIKMQSQNSRNTIKLLMYESEECTMTAYEKHLRKKLLNYQTKLGLPKHQNSWVSHMIPFQDGDRNVRSTMRKHMLETKINVHKVKAAGKMSLKKRMQSYAVQMRY